MPASGESGAKGGDDARRARSTRLARLVPSLARKAYRRRGFASDEVIARWREIVGGELAELSAPVRLRFPRDRRRGGVLEMRIEPAQATRLQHQESEILERVNMYFGYRAVERLQLVQGPVAERRNARRGARARREPPADSPARAQAQRLAEPVADDELRALLSRWGAEILDEKGD